MFNQITDLITETTETKNEMIVSVTARRGANGIPFTFTQTIPQGTVRGTRFVLGTANDLFDRVDDVQKRRLPGKWFPRH